MASSARSNLDLRLSALPDYQGEDKELFAELIRIYNAIRTVASGVDFVLGGDAADSETPSTDSYTIGNLCKFYATYAEDVSYGEFVAVTTSGIVKAQGFNTAPNLKPAVGFCAAGDGVTAGSVGPVCTCGIINASGLTVGTTYCLAPDGGIIDYFTYESTYTASPGASYPVVWYPQILGKAVTADRLLVNIHQMNARVLTQAVFPSVGIIVSESGYYG